MAIYDTRLRRGKFYLGLCYVAVAIGLGWLAIILATLLFEGFRAISPAVFTQMTPPPGSEGGLLNAITGSLIMTFLGVALGTPLGMLAGTYMAEYGRHSKLTIVVRFINDILLSAPSIVIGLFVYEVMVVRMGHFSALAGSVALAVIVVPVVGRRTCYFWCPIPCAKRRARSVCRAPLSSARSPIAPPAQVSSPGFFSPSPGSAAKPRLCSLPR
jgi:phosphate transport system permease protein